MQFLANTKTVELFSSSAYDSSIQTAINGAFDTQGFEEAFVCVDLSTNASSGSFSAALQSSDTNGSFTTIAGTGQAFALPTKGTGLYGWYVDLRGAAAYNRWLNVKIALGYSVTGISNISGFAVLGRPALGVSVSGGTATTQVQGGNGMTATFYQG